jgi:signal transduction histidine kinase
MLFTIGAEVRDLQGAAVDPLELAEKLKVLERQIAATAACFRESLAVLDGVAPQQALTATLRGDCDALSGRTEIVARCVALTELPELSDSHRGALVALVREALVNVEKHSRASSVVVSLTATDGGLTVAVADDGMGWSEAAERTVSGRPYPERAVGDCSTGIGLQASYDRIAQLGGTLSVVGNEDGGLTVRAWLPAP